MKPAINQLHGQVVETPLNKEDRLSLAKIIKAMRQDRRGLRARK